MARKTLDDIIKSNAQVDRLKFDATTEEDIRRYQIEDGEDPDQPLDSFVLVTPAARVREKLGLTQVAFAKAIGVPVATIRNWEQGRVNPEPAAQSLLRILDQRPDVLAVLAN